MSLVETRRGASSIGWPTTNVANNRTPTAFKAALERKSFNLAGEDDESLEFAMPLASAFDRYSETVTTVMSSGI